MFKGPHTEEAKARQRAASLGRAKSPEEREKIRRAHIGMKASAETRAKIAESRRREGRMARLWEDPAFREAQRIRSSERMKARHADPAFKAKALERLKAENAARRAQDAARMVFERLAASMAPAE